MGRLLLCRVDFFGLLLADLLFPRGTAVDFTSKLLDPLGLLSKPLVCIAERSFGACHDFGEVSLPGPKLTKLAASTANMLTSFMPITLDAIVVL